MGNVVSNGRTGRSDADQPTIMKVARTPVFVDNCVHHAIYATGNSSQKMAVTPAAKNSFQVASERTYQVVEEESAVRLVHTQKPGHFYEGDVYFAGEKLSTGATLPVVMYGSEDYSERIVADSVESTNLGSRLTLPNMKGQTLQTIGFEEGSVRLGHEIDVGLRTTDLAMKLAVTAIDDVLTSINLSRKTTPYAVIQEKISHSQTFLAHDFYKTNLISALRFIGKHDKRMVKHDKFGNLSYTKIQSGEEPKTLNILDARIQQVHKTPSMDRVTIVGKQRGLNFNVQSTVSNPVNQYNRDGSTSTKDGGIIVDPTIKNMSSARRIGREILSQNNKSESSVIVTNSIDNQSLNAGDLIKINNQTKMVSKVTHKLKNRTTDLVITDGFSTHEMYNQFIEDGVFNDEKLIEDVTSGTSQEVLSFDGNIFTGVYILASGRLVSNRKKLIGSGTRSVIGRKNIYIATPPEGGCGLITITAGGSGYSVNDVITLTNAASSSTKMQVKVKDVDGSGAVEKAVITVAGTLYTLGANLTQHAVSPSGGSGFQCSIPTKPHGLNTIAEEIGSSKSINIKQGGIA